MRKLYFFMVILLSFPICSTYANDYSIDFDLNNDLDGYTKVDEASITLDHCSDKFNYNPTSPSDDGYIAYDAKNFSFNYLGNTISNTFYLNVNGTITFDEPLCGYEPKALNELGMNVIAAYWCDIDLRFKADDGGLFVKEIPSGNGDTKAIKFLWYKVGAYRSDSVYNNGKYVTFQITLVNQKYSSNGDNVFLCYETLDFTDGSASQGFPAIVGFLAGNELLEIGSFTDSKKATEYLIDNSKCTPSKVGDQLLVTHSQICEDGKYLIKVFNSTSESCTLKYDEDDYTVNQGQQSFSFPADGKTHTVVVSKDGESLYDGNVTAPQCSSSDCPSDDWDININGEDLAASYCSNKLLEFSTKSKKGAELTNPKYTWSFSNSESSDLSTPEKTYTVASEQTVTVKITSDECKEGITLERDFVIDVCPVDSVCPTEFAPTAGKKYILSGWMHVEGAKNVTSYADYGSIEVKYEGSDQVDECKPSGDIIDEWQRIYKEIRIPDKATQLFFVLKSKENGKDCYFDDIRFLPIDASMVSYVYDPVTLRLVAELDNENYATFYEYDEEGALIRVKKETERGIMTIKEARQGGVKLK